MIFNPTYISSLGEMDFDLGILFQNKPNSIPRYPNRKDFEPGMIIVAWECLDRYQVNLRLVFCDTKQVVTFSYTPSITSSFPTFNIQQYTNEEITIHVNGTDGTENIFVNFGLENFGYSSTYYRFAGAYYLPN